MLSICSPQGAPAETLKSCILRHYNVNSGSTIPIENNYFTAKVTVDVIDNLQRDDDHANDEANQSDALIVVYEEGEEGIEERVKEYCEKVVPQTMGVEVRT